MKKLAIFDFDGTLFNSVDDVVICFNKALTKHNFPTLEREEFIGCLGGNIDEIVSLVLKDKNTPENMEMLKDRLKKSQQRKQALEEKSLKNILKVYFSDKQKMLRPISLICDVWLIIFGRK